MGFYLPTKSPKKFTFVKTLIFNFFFSFSETQQKGHGMGNLLSKIVLGTTGGRPDFNVEEKVSIEKDSRELKQIVREMADYLPREDPEKGEGGG